MEAEGPGGGPRGLAGGREGRVGRRGPRLLVRRVVWLRGKLSVRVLLLHPIGRLLAVRLPRVLLALVLCEAGGAAFVPPSAVARWGDCRSRLRIQSAPEGSRLRRAISRPTGVRCHRAPRLSPHQ